MKNTLLLIALFSAMPLSALRADSSVVDSLLQEYMQQGSVEANISQGEQLWQQRFNGSEQRSCTSCHTNDLTQPGKHVTTGKLIDPMSPSVNPQRLSDSRQVNKWFKRNCKWTLGRECTPQEKANFLVYINNSPTQLY